jgi:tubulin delta
MSFSILQVGQAGNQIGYELWRLFRKEIPEFSDSVFDSFNNEKARWVLVDTEPKVVREYLEDPVLKEFFSKDNIFYTEEGRGNNWAYGYQSVQDGFNEKIMDALRREAENWDYYEGTVMVHSIAGGTGSGLGSRLMEEFKDQYSKAKLVNVVVWPHPSGETPLQNYNSWFTTSFLQKYSDAVIVFQNEEMLKIIPKWIDDKKIQSVSMKNLNEYISVCLKNVFVPCSDEKISLYDIIELAPAPQLKLLSWNTNPFFFSGKLSWDKFKDWQDIISTCISQINIK